MRTAIGQLMSTVSVPQTAERTISPAKSPGRTGAAELVLRHVQNPGLLGLFTGDRSGAVQPEHSIVQFWNDLHGDVKSPR
jgi:hypothetical protein